MTELLREIIQKIEKMPLVHDNSSVSSYYQHLPVQKASLYLSGFQALNDTMCLMESHGMDKKEIKKGALMFLAVLNILFSEKSENDDFQNITKALYHVHALEDKDTRNKILLGFLCIGLSLFKNFPHEKDILSEKIIIGELHNIGGFQPDMWGISIEFNLFAELITNLLNISTPKKIKLHLHYNSIRIEELTMISRFIT